jgi:DNA-binding CsgD family transcriptional regulator
MGDGTWVDRGGLRAGLGSGLGLTVLAASLLLGLALTVVPALGPWAERASWVVGWGLLAHLAIALVTARSTPAPAEPARPGPGPLEPPRPDLAPADPVQSDPDPADPPLPGPGPYPDGLTRREVEVLCLLAEGGTNKEIARRLVVSVATVERHVANIYAKIGAHGRAGAATHALRRGLCQAVPERAGP